MADKFVNIDRVLDFVDRTTSHGVPLRIAVKRAERQFALDRHLIQQFVRARARRYAP